MSDKTVELSKIDREKLLEVKSYLEKRFDVKITSNKKKIEIQAIAYALDIIGVKDQEAFMKEVAITLYHHMYLPFDVGTMFIEPIVQLETLAHECQHVIQWNKDPLSFAPVYLTQHERRAYWETEALACNMELHYRLTGQMYSPKDLSKHLKWYKCSGKDIKVAEKKLAILTETFKQSGTYSTPVEEIFSVL